MRHLFDEGQADIVRIQADSDRLREVRRLLLQYMRGHEQIRQSVESEIRERYAETGFPLVLGSLFILDTQHLLRARREELVSLVVGLVNSSGANRDRWLDFLKEQVRKELEQPNQVRLVLLLAWDELTDVEPDAAKALYSVLRSPEDMELCLKVLGKVSPKDALGLLETELGDPLCYTIESVGALAQIVGLAELVPDPQHRKGWLDIAASWTVKALSHDDKSRNLSFCKQLEGRIATSSVTTTSFAHFILACEGANIGGQRQMQYMMQDVLAPLLQREKQPGVSETLRVLGAGGRCSRMWQANGVFVRADLPDVTACLEGLLGDSDREVQKQAMIQILLQADHWGTRRPPEVQSALRSLRDTGMQRLDPFVLSDAHEIVGRITGSDKRGPVVIDRGEKRGHGKVK